MASAIEILSLIAPEFDSLDLAVREAYISVVAPQVSSCQFASDYNLGVAYLAADMIATTDKDQGVSAEAVLKKEGDLQIQYGLLLPSPSGYITKFGRMFDVLKKKHVFTGMVANSNVGC